MLVGGLLAAVVCVFLGKDRKKSIATSRHGEITSAAGSSGLLLRLEELTDRLENLSNEELPQFNSGLANSNSQTAAELHVTFDSFFVDRGYFISGQLDSSRCLQAFAFLRSMSAKEVAMLAPGWFDADEDAIAREAASGPKPSNSRSHLLLDRWLELDPEAARVYVQNRGSDDLLDSYFELQAMRDPLAALNEVEAFVGEDRPRLICVVLRELAKKESVRALTLYETETGILTYTIQHCC